MVVGLSLRKYRSLPHPPKFVAEYAACLSSAYFFHKRVTPGATSIMAASLTPAFQILPRNFRLRGRSAGTPKVATRFVRFGG